MIDFSDTIVVTGGAGFIGSNFVLQWLKGPGTAVLNLDALTYAGNAENLESVKNDQRHRFVCGDICDAEHVASIVHEHRPRAIVHFAAESHVDRSIADPGAFVRTNVHGTLTLLEQARRYWSQLDSIGRQAFRFVHVSTDEVYGSLGPEDSPFSETTAYAPNSPYAASKAGSDHLVRAYYHTYGMPVLTTNCSNNYGPYQFPEKLIPADDSERGRRKAPAGVRRRLQRARLAVRRGSLCGDLLGASPRPRRRNLQYWRE